MPLLLDCNLGASDTPFNVTWHHDGQPLPLEGADFLQYLANGSLLLLPTSEDGQFPQGMEGGYSCVSASALGALTSRTVNVLLASRCPLMLVPKYGVCFDWLNVSKCMQIKAYVLQMYSLELAGSSILFIV